MGISQYHKIFSPKNILEYHKYFLNKKNENQFGNSQVRIMAALNAPIVSQMEINSEDVFDERSILPKREGLYGHVRSSKS